MKNQKETRRAQTKSAVVVTAVHVCVRAGRAEKRGKKGRYQKVKIVENVESIFEVGTGTDISFLGEKAVSALDIPSDYQIPMMNKLEMVFYFDTLCARARLTNLHDRHSN